MLAQEPEIEKPPEKQEDQNEKRYSVQMVIGSGFGRLGVLKDRYDPATSLSEFVALAIYSASQAGAGYGSSLSGNLNSGNLLNLYALNDQISSTPIQSVSQSSINRFYLEARPKVEHIAFLFGLSSGNYSLRADASRNENVFLPTIFFGNTNPILNIYMAQSFVANSKPIYLGINTFDAAMKYYFFPENKFDPYIGAGVGLGSCLINCNAFRIFGKIGFRYNFQDSYLFLEEELQSIYFLSKDNAFQPMRERITLFGFGVYL